jgi:hypothetical protein
MFPEGLLFEISYTFYATNGTLFFVELGRLYRYESSSDSLRSLRMWRGFDLLVWNPADTTRKKNGLLLLLLMFFTFCVHSVCGASNQLRSYGPIWVLNFFCPIRLSEINFLWPKFENVFQTFWLFTRCNHKKYYNFFEIIWIITHFLLNRFEKFWVNNKIFLLCCLSDSIF